MKFITTDKENRVVCIDYFPKEGLEGGFYVDEIPELIQKKGFYAILNYTKDRGFYTSYEEIPESNEQIQAKRITDLEQSVIELTLKLAKVGV